MVRHAAVYTGPWSGCGPVSHALGQEEASAIVDEHNFWAHLHDHDEDPHEPDLAADDATDDAIWHIDNVELTTVGIDVGSATSHLMFSRILLHRQGMGLSSRFVVVSREVLHRSPIMLTPYRADGLIDDAALGRFIGEQYVAASLPRAAVDAGAVILTGVALERQNSRAIADLFAAEGGRFVCASAGHNLEALLAAHGSGAVAASRTSGPVLNIDIGGGTTKFSLCVDGQVTATMAMVGGSRLVTLDDNGHVGRLEASLIALQLPAAAGIEPGALLDGPQRERIGRQMAGRIVEAVAGQPLAGAVLAGALPRTPGPGRIVLSGGVAELLSGSDSDISVARDGHYGDLGSELATALLERLGRLGVPLALAQERIRATVIGASQFSVQLSGNTIHLSGPIRLPEHNVPVVAVDLPADGELTPTLVRGAVEQRVRQLDLDGHDGALAIALRWEREPLYANLRAVAEGITAAHRAAPRRGAPIVLALTVDIAANVGAVIHDELGVAEGVIAIDGLELSDLDFIDIGQQIPVTHVVPVVIKSLIFPTAGTSERPRILGGVA